MAGEQSSPPQQHHEVQTTRRQSPPPSPVVVPAQPEGNHAPDHALGHAPFYTDHDFRGQHMENGQADPEAGPRGGPQQHPKTGCGSEPLLSKLIIDFICLLIVWIPVLMLFLVGQPYERGYFCDDETIRHPFIPSTIPNWLLYLLGGGLPLLAIVVIEAVHCRSNRSKKRAVARHSFFNRQVHPYLWECYHAIGVFGFGAGCSQLLTDIAKYGIGRLRPHFIDVCQPNVDCDSNKWKYIEDFTCQGSDVDKIHDARLSFPSGHSSFSFYTMVYLALYLQARLTWDGSWLLRPLLQVLAVCLAWGTALSRVSDYKHHWSDVLSGGVLGSLVAVLTGLYVSRLFKPRGSPQVRFRDSMTSEDATLPLTNRANSEAVGYQSIQHPNK